jgi:uncharacterized protein (TIGR02266 family)
MSDVNEPWNRRRFERLAVRCGCWLEGEGLTVYGHTVDLGRGGLFLRTAAKVPHGTSVQIALRLPDRDSVVRTSGTVVWSGHAGGRTGIAVALAAENDDVFLRAFFDARDSQPAPRPD